MYCCQVLSIHWMHFPHAETFQNQEEHTKAQRGPFDGKPQFWREARRKRPDLTPRARAVYINNTHTHTHTAITRNDRTVMPQDQKTASGRRRWCCEILPCVLGGEQPLSMNTLLRWCGTIIQDTHTETDGHTQTHTHTHTHTKIEATNVKVDQLFSSSAGQTTVGNYKAWKIIICNSCNLTSKYRYPHYFVAFITSSLKF